MTVHDAAPSDQARLAAQYGLTPIGRQPALGQYIRSIWDRRHFLRAFAQSQVRAENTESRLGQVWQVLNPLLNAMVYYLVFGVILKAKNGVENYTAFLITGVFIFFFAQKTIMAGARSVSSNMELVRALHFPRAILPLASAMQELMETLLSLVVLMVIVLGTGEPLTLNWLQLPFIIALELLFCAGVGMFFARLTAYYRDVSQFLPFVLRIWMYFSGVMYSIENFTAKHDHYAWADLLLTINPANIYIQLVRGSLMATAPAPTFYWAWAVFWAVACGLIGFLFFWRAESRYGRG